MFIALYSELRAETTWQYGGLQMLCTANCHTKILKTGCSIWDVSFFLSLVFPILTCAYICCVINEKSKFYTKNTLDWEKKKHLRLNIPFSGFSYGNSLYITFARGEVKITFFVEDHMVTSRCLFCMGLSLGRWAVVSLTFSYINKMTLPLRWRVKIDHIVHV
jgi:hypothetical protein